MKKLLVSAVCALFLAVVPAAFADREGRGHDKRGRRSSAGPSCPLGGAPDGVSGTGFVALADDRAAERSGALPLLAGGAFRPDTLGGDGSATVKDGVVTARLRSTR